MKFITRHRRRYLWPVLLAGALAGTALIVSSGSASPVRSAVVGAPRSPVYGVTLDDVSSPQAIAASLRGLPVRPTARVYFDSSEPPSYYTRAIRTLHPISYLMGELLDSSDETSVSTSAYAQRTRSYLAAFGGEVDVWEVGNEVNGNWTGSYATVAAKLTAAYDQVKGAGKRAALTLYYNVGCGDGSRELDPLAFSRRYVPARIRDGLDLVLLSYYERNCRGLRPTQQAWSNYFARLHAVYPHAKLGFGEIGLPDPVSAADVTYAKGVAQYYYGMRIALPYYIGGYFWWYYVEDCVLDGHFSLQPTLARALSAEKRALG